MNRATMLVLALLFASCGPVGIYPVLDSPVKLDELDGDYLWPYGVHGGGHPEGHPGFDFFSATQRIVYAPADGTIASIADNDKAGKDLSFAAGPLLLKIQHITPSASLESGQNVRRGEVIGQLTLIDGRYMIHFGVAVGASDRCPAHFMSPETVARFGTSASEAGTIMDLATYSEKTIEPLLCNPM